MQALLPPHHTHTHTQTHTHTHIQEAGLLPRAEEEGPLPRCSNDQRSQATMSLALEFRTRR